MEPYLSFYTFLSPLSFLGGLSICSFLFLSLSVYMLHALSLFLSISYSLVSWMSIHYQLSVNRILH